MTIKRNVILLICLLSYVLWANIAYALEPVRIDGIYYSTLQDAYDDAMYGDTIQSRNAVFCEDLYLDDNNTSVTLEGGYNDDFSAIIGKTFLGGNLFVSGGSATIENYLLQDELQCGSGFSDPKTLLPVDDGVSLFGWSVAINGDYAIVGAYAEEEDSDRGAVYIFHKTGPDEWDSGTKIKTGSWIGASVAISGDYAIASDRGQSAYIFKRTGTNTWDSGTLITPTGPEKWSEIGNSVAISGDYVIMGATFGEGSVPGAAYIFQRTGLNSWSSATRIAAADGEDGDYFGSSVDINGDYAVVGASRENDGGTYAGAAYIFQRTGPNSWGSGTKIVAPDAEADDRFGWSVAISGDYAVVGAIKEDEGGSNAGAAYMFRRTGSDSWDFDIKIMAPDTLHGLFGNSVEIDGDFTVVGALGYGGAAYVFKRTGTGSWDSGIKLFVPNSLYFGQSVSISNGNVIVGDAMNGTPAASGTTPDTAYIFLKNP